MRLAAWKEMPKASRPSLRALAKTLGASHQLLRYYLKRLEEWKGKEYLHRARDIRARARAENRVLTSWEEQQADAYNRVGFHTLIHSILLDDIQRMKKESERRPLRRQEIKALRILAREFPAAQELLQKCLQRSLGSERKFATASLSRR